MRQRHFAWVPFVVAAAIDCGGETTSSTGNTNWLICDDDSECGTDVCQCGVCAPACNAHLDCSLPPEDMCVAGPVPDGGSLPGLEQLWAVQDPDAQGLELAIGADGSVWVAGGSDRTYFDLSYMYPSYFLGHFNGGTGAPLGDARTPDYGAAVGLALSGDGRVATLTTNYVDGNRTTLLVRDALSGEVWVDREVLEEATAAVFTSSGTLVLGGSHLLGDVGGRPTADLWLTELDASGDPLWTLAPESPQRGWTGVSSLALVSDRMLVVGGYQGVTTQSNASVPWVLGVSDGAVVWEHVYDSGAATTGRVESVAARPGGGVLVRGVDTEGSWVRALSADGETEWTERLDLGYGAGTVAPLPGGGYAVTATVTVCPECLEPASTAGVVTGYDASRAPSWQVRVEGCETARAAAVTADGTLVVLALCDWGLGLYGYALP